MDGWGAVLAESSAVLATLLAAASAFPQLHRVLARGDRHGVSVTSGALGIGTEVAWVLYACHGGLWSALPEAVLMAVANTLLVIALVRRGAASATAWRAAAGWAAVLVAAGVLGGSGALATALAVGYSVQVAPAVWTAWTTSCPSGVAALTWVMIGAEGVLWGVYGVHHGDPATISFAVIATAASAAMTARTTSSRPRSTVAAPSPAGDARSTAAA